MVQRLTAQRASAQILVMNMRECDLSLPEPADNPLYSSAAVLPGNVDRSACVVVSPVLEMAAYGQELARLKLGG